VLIIASSERSATEMAIVMTALARVRDWGPALRGRHYHLAECARRAGATRCSLFRDVHDASEALFLIVLPGHDALRLFLIELAADETTASCPIPFRAWEQIESSEVGS
jgi:hypothetical protein